MSEASPERWVVAWSEIIGQTLGGSALLGGANPPPGAEAAVMNEAIADLIAIQIAGGMNRFLPVGALVTGPGNNICIPGMPNCADDNYGGPFMGSPLPADPFNARVATETTRLHDVFDGGFFVLIFGDVFHDGSAWATAPATAPFQFTGMVTNALGADAVDEQVRLLNFTLNDIVSRWALSASVSLTDESFYRAVTGIARLDGVADANLCQAYGLHEPTLACDPAYFP